VRQGYVITGTATAALIALLGIVPGAAASQVALYDNSGGGSFELGGATVAANGALIDPVPHTTTPGVGYEGLAVTPNGSNLLAVGKDGGLDDFSIGPAGELVKIDDAAIESTDGYGIVTTPDGKHAYVADSSGGVLAYSVGDEGVPSPLPDQGVTLTDPTGLAMDPDGRHLYAATKDGDVVSYGFDPDGYLLDGDSRPMPTEAYAISITPDGEDLYVAEDQAPNELLKFSVGDDGSLTPSGAGTPLAGDGTFGMTITPNGKYLYTANYSGGSVSAFRLGSGAPTPIQPFPVAFEGFDSPTAVTTNAAGTRLYVNDGANDIINVLAIAADGALSTTPDSPFETGFVGDFQSVALTPAQPPHAAFATSINGKRVTFDGSDSSDPDGTVARYDWIFGDGATLSNGGSKPTHKYKHGSKPRVTLTVTDNEGCSARYLASGQTPFCNGKPTARITALPFQAKLPKDDSQKLGDVVKVKIGCPADCTVKASGKLKLSGGAAKAAKLKGDKAKIDAGKSKTLKLKLSKKAHDAAKDTKKAIAKIKVKATDASGDQDKQKLNVKLK
jgi:DNA-binding beta-propeller fold protein YncE